MNSQSSTRHLQSGGRTRLLAAACLLVFPALAQADTISISFGYGTVLNPRDAFYPQAANWNQWTAGSASRTNFVNSSGAPVTGLTLTWNNPNATQSNEHDFYSPTASNHHYSSTIGAGTGGLPAPQYDALGTPVGGNQLVEAVAGDAGFGNLSGKAALSDRDYAQFKLTGLPAGSSVAVLGCWLGLGNYWTELTAPGSQIITLTWAGQRYTSQLVLETTGPLAGTETFYFNGQTPGLPVNAQSRVAISAIQIVTPVSPYVAWITGYYPTPNDPNAGPTADPDADGLANGIEFVTGSDPTKGSPSPLRAEVSGANVVFSFDRLKDANAAGVSVAMEVSTDPDVSWPSVYAVQPDPVAPEISAASNGAFDSVSLTVPRGVENAIFARLTVTITP